MEKLLELLMTSPELAGGMINEMVTKYKSVFYSVLSEGFEMYKDLNANDEYFTQKAIAKKKMLDAYCNAGFSREEALVFILDNETTKVNMLKSFSSF